jgi:hypothetical protein
VIENNPKDYPIFPNEVITKCTDTRDYRPILFEWYKYVGILSNSISCISLESPAIREIPPSYFAVLIGLLNRCSRLMLANIRLSSTGKYGETTRLLDRCISESAIKIQWLCSNKYPDGFIRYLADGLKNDLILKEEIEKNIQDRKGNILVIEQRMLDSIQKCIKLSGLTEQEVKNAKKLHDFAKMFENLELPKEFYTVIQRMGSHAVHGTWSELVFNYLNYDEINGFSPRDHEIDTQDAQYIVIIHLVLGAMESLLKFIINDVSERNEIIVTIKEIDNKIMDIQHLAWDTDFEINK